MKNIIRIDLTTFSSKEDILKYIKFRGLKSGNEIFRYDDEEQDLSSKLWKLTQDNYIFAWIDSSTNDIIAFENESGQNFTQEFMNFMCDAQVEGFGEDMSKSFTKDELCLDSVLDKINKSGIESLTTEEVEFLGNIKY